MVTRLAKHEWISVGTLTGFLLLMTFIAWMDDEPLNTRSIHLNVQRVRVTISGAVASPGEYLLPIPSTIADLLNLAQPLPIADLRRINLESRLREGRHINIFEIPQITIYVKGAIDQEGSMQLPKGSTYQTLLNMLHLTHDADTGSIPLNKRLRDKQTVTIPRSST